MSEFSHGGSSSGGGAPSGSAGGDLSGTFPNPTVANLNGIAAASYALLASPTFTGTPTGVARPIAYGGNGLKCCSFDDPAVVGSSVALSTGATIAVWMNVYAPVAITNVYCITNGTVMSGATTNENLIGLYSADGQTKLATSPDQSAVWTSNGVKAAAVSATLSMDGCWAVFLCVATTTATMRATANNGAAVPNFGPTNTSQASSSGAARCGIIASSGQTALPATFTPSTLTPTSQVVLVGCA